jgi:hypothetical protein
MDQDFISGSDGVASQLQAFVVPAPSQKTRRNGAPTVLLMPARSKSGPPAHRYLGPDRPPQPVARSRPKSARSSAHRPAVACSILPRPTRVDPQKLADCCPRKHIDSKTKEPLEKLPCSTLSGVECQIYSRRRRRRKNPNPENHHPGPPQRHPRKDREPGSADRRLKEKTHRMPLSGGGPNCQIATV